MSPKFAFTNTFHLSTLVFCVCQWLTGEAAAAPHEQRRDGVCLQSEGGLPHQPEIQSESTSGHHLNIQAHPRAADTTDKKSEDIKRSYNFLTII